MNQQGTTIFGESQSVAVDKATLRKLRGPLLPRTDLGFFIIVLVSLILHGILVYEIRSKKLAPPQQMLLEQIPERMAKLIIDKPLPKVDKKAPTVAQEKSTESAKNSLPNEAETVKNTENGTPKYSEQQKAVAKSAVSARIARVESKVRTIGVLGMLTGVGTTARGPAVVDVLGSMGARKERTENLDQALENMTGLSKAQSVDVLSRKLVKSKDVEVTHKEAIDELIAGVAVAKTAELTKRGDIVIQKPESIEGAASQNSKRDNNAINMIVSNHKASIRMSYEKYLKRNPNLAGKITIRFTISASGTVTEIKVLENTTTDSEFEQEIVRKIRMWQFDPIQEGDATVTYPFVFTPAS